MVWDHHINDNIITNLMTPFTKIFFDRNNSCIIALPSSNYKLDCQNQITLFKLNCCAWLLPKADEDNPSLPTNVHGPCDRLLQKSSIKWIKSMCTQFSPYLLLNLWSRLAFPSFIFNPRSSISFFTLQFK